MKNRPVPFCLLSTFFGLALLLLSFAPASGQTGTPELRTPDGSWYESVRANQHTGMISQSDVLKARLQADEQRYKAAGAGMGLNWISAGPDNYPGMVWSSIFDNTDPSGLTILAGTAGGGVWKSINLGLSWSPMGVENSLVPKVSSMVQTSNGTVYAATGVTVCKSVKYAGNGIFRSVGGGDFTLIPGTQGNPDFSAVAKMAIHTASGKLYAATFGGLYVSDNGDDWSKVLSGYGMDVCVGSDGTVIAVVADSAYLAPGGDFNAKVNLTSGKAGMLPKVALSWMVFTVAPSDPNVIYASLANPDGKLFSIYLSEDKGNTWSVVFPNNPTFEPFGTTGNGCYSHTLAVFPNDPYKILLGGVNMWVGSRINTTGYYNWEQVSFGSHGDYSPFYVPQYHHQYFFRPGVNNQLVIASDGGVSIATIGEDITFQTSNKNLKSSQFNSVAFSAQKHFVMGGGERIGTLVMGYFQPSQVNTPTEGYQVYRRDASALGASSQPHPNNYPGTGGSCLWSNIDSRVAIYTKYKADSTSETPFKPIRRQDFSDITRYNYFLGGLVDTVSSARVPMALWETFNQGQVFGITRDTSRYIAESDSVPAGATILVQSNSNRVLFPYHVTTTIPKGDTIYVADPLASRFVVYGRTTSYRGIFLTKNMLRFDRAIDYYTIFKEGTTADPVTALTLSNDLNTLWAGTKAGRLIRITNLVNAWDSATANITSSQCVLVDTVYSTTPFTGRTVTSISINPNNPNLVLVTLGNYGNQDYVYYCQNGGADSPVFTSVQGNLPQVPVFSGLLEMTSNGNALLGTDLGVFSTTNLGQGATQWAPDMSNIGVVPVTEIRQQTMNNYHILNRGVIYLASFGRGLWMDTTYYSPVGIEPVYGESGDPGKIQITPNPVRDLVTLTFSVEKSGNATLSVYDLTGRIIVSDELGYRTPGTHSTTLQAGSLATGTYIVRIGNASGKFVKH